MVILLPPPPDGPDVDRCKLLGQTGLIVQASMGIFVILSLVVKRQLERRKRSWRIWLWDVSKQLVGQAVVHGLNVLISDLVALVGNNNPCSLYFLNVLIDTTVGVAILYFSLKGLTWYFSKHLGLEGFISGQYGKPPQPLFWWKQLLPYILSIIIMKLLVLLPLTLPGVSPALVRFSNAFLDYLSPRVQVIFVMALFPLVMNILQFCLIDQVIKAGKDADDDTATVRHSNTRRGGGAEYQRLPTWEGIGASTETTDHIARRRPSASPLAKDITDPLSPKGIAPTSPLLSPHPVDYGSTTPSPTGSPTRPSSDTDVDVGGSIWSKLLNQARSFDVSSAMERGDRLYVGRERGRGDRSAAPSPESFTVPATNADHCPPISKSTGFTDVSRLSSSVERQARRTLSPPTSPTVKQPSSSFNGLSMTDVVRDD